MITTETLKDMKSVLVEIDESQWCTEVYKDQNCKRCAAGHYAWVKTGRDWPPDRGVESTIPYGVEFDLLGLFEVNDGKNPMYQQPTPKARVLAFLNDEIERLTPNP